MVPMVQTAVADYRMHMRAELPAPQLAALEQETGVPLTILPAAQATLVAAWVVPMRGTLAAALAYRVDHHIVVQYVVRRSLFFRQPQVRRAVRHGGLYRAQAGHIAVIAWPGAHSGQLMVGRVPARLLRTLKM